MAKETFPEHEYVSLKELDLRAFADEDPRGFLQRYGNTVIIDEIQRVPNLFSYIQTYIERDVRTLINVDDFASFERFLSLVAGRTGQILNYTSIANDCGVALDTVKRWLSMLITSAAPCSGIWWFPSASRHLPISGNSPLFYWRDQTGHEIDQIIEESSHLYAVEIKSGQTVSPDMFDTLRWWSTTTGNPPEKTILVYGGDHASSRAGIRVFPWSSV